MEQGDETRRRRKLGSYRSSIMGGRLWRQAQSDLLNERRLLAPQGYYGAVFFAHQAAEKALKGVYWQLRSEEPPWKHDLVLCLAGIEKSGTEMPCSVQDACERLQPMFEASRYPSGNADEPIPAEAILDEDALLAVQLAEEVIAWVHKLMQ